MDTTQSSKRSLGCLSLLVLLMIAGSYFVTGSLNPLTVFTTGSLWAKGLLILFAVLALSPLLQFLYAQRANVLWLIFILIFYISTSALFEDPAQDNHVRAA